MLYTFLKVYGNENGENQRVFVSNLPMRNRQKRKCAATSRNIARRPFFIVLSFSALSLIQYKKFDIIYVESKENQTFQYKTILQIR